MIRPDFYIIGAAKCGTTTLAHALSNQPEVFIPEIKELNFFSNEKNFKRGQKYYSSFFSNAEHGQLLGDASPQYIFSDLTATRMRALHEDHKPKLIAVLREPVSRAYSSYWQAFRAGWTKKSFEDALEEESSLLVDQDYLKSGRTIGAYLSAGNYAKQLRHWLEYFSTDNMLILLTEDLKQSSTEIKVGNFLEKRFPSGWLTGTWSNQATMPRVRSIDALVRGQNKYRKTITKLLPESVRARIKKSVDRFNQKTFHYPPMNEKTKGKLKAHFLPEIEDLEKLIKRDLSAWKE